MNESIKQAPEKLETTYAEMANNVIMYNCPEPNIKNKDERIEKSWETINNFLTDGVKIGSMKIINAYRLGKYNDTKKQDH